MALKEKIQAICKAKKIPTYKLEEDCGFAKGYISKLDKSVPNTDKIRQIADYLDVSVDYLLDRQDYVDYKVNYTEDEISMMTNIKNSSALRALIYAAMFAKDDDINFAKEFLEKMKDRV